MPELLRREYPTHEIEEDNFERDADFIRAHYPGDAERIINEALDGFDVVYAEEDGEIMGLATYSIATDNHGETYMMIGVAVVDEDAREEGYGKQLFEAITEIAEAQGIAYMTAKADTSYGQLFLERLGFYEVEDEVSGIEHYRLDLDA